MEGPFRIETKPFVTETVEEKPREVVALGADEPATAEQPSRTTRMRRALRRFFVGD
jgi:hypothetical protein